MEKPPWAEERAGTASWALPSLRLQERQTAAGDEASRRCLRGDRTMMGTQDPCLQHPLAGLYRADSRSDIKSPAVGGGRRSVRIPGLRSQSALHRPGWGPVLSDPCPRGAPSPHADRERSPQPTGLSYTPQPSAPDRYTRHSEILYPSLFCLVLDALSKERCISCLLVFA